MKFILIILLILSKPAMASNDSLRADLSALLKQRNELFNAYSASLSRKSGFFGNQTKNDIRESQDKLKEIVEIDNRIMSTLNRTLDYRNFEKTNMTYDVSSYVTRIQNLATLN